MTESGQRRYAPGRARHEEILDAAYALFGEVGYGGVSLRGVAARAGISHASLLRYFSSKDRILLALLERWGDDTRDWFRGHPEVDLEQGVIDLARRNAAIPGYLELFSALVGEATSERHPGHEHFRRHYRGLRAVPIGQKSLEAGLLALWDGLQIMSLYLDEIDVTRELEAYLETDAAAPRTWDDPGPGTFAPGAEPESTRYAPGRRKRAQIIDSAVELFAQQGFTATSLSEIAAHVGLSKSTLIHHIGSKDALLAAVLERRDLLVAEMVSRSEVLAVEKIVDGARANEAGSGFVELYTVLVCEATAADHPAHEYFAQRYRAGIRHFAGLFARLPGSEASTADALRRAAWFMALWDGLQVQWLYDADAVDIPAELERFATGR